MNIFEGIASIVMYNGLQAPLEKIREVLTDQNDRAYIDLEDIDMEEQILIAQSKVDIFWLGQVQFLWMLLVLLFGNYGTSPRWGWIENKKAALDFIDKLLSEREVDMRG